MKGSKILGVHIRAAFDKKGGKRKDVPVDKYMKIIKEGLLSGNYDKIYIATDYQPLFEDIVKKFGDKVIYSDCKRSHNGYPVVCGCKKISKKRVGGAIPGEEAIIESILLSKCDHLVHGLSNLSASALYFNPKISYETIMVE